MIKIACQGFISELGKRANNEDRCAFIKGSTYVVCDGVGGAEKGEVASDITVRSFIEAFKTNVNADANQVLKTAEGTITAYVNDNPNAAGMASTLTLSQVRKDGIYVAWVGDSRIYQIRNGTIIFKTTDHSWVNDALKSGIITPEEAVNHPKANVITRAIQGNNKPTTAETRLLTDIEKGDMFLMCSDGVLESWNDDDINALFSSEKVPDKILEIIKRECSQHSKDNFTAIVFCIEEAFIEQKNVPISQKEVEAIPLDENEITVNRSIIRRDAGILKLLKRKIFGIPLVVYLVAILPFFFFFILTNIKKESQVNQGDPIPPRTIEILQPADESTSKIKQDSLIKAELLEKKKLDSINNIEKKKPIGRSNKSRKEIGKQI